MVSVKLNLLKPKPHIINNRNFRVVDETDDWIVIDKPPHLKAHPSKPNGPYTLWDGLRELLAFEIANGGQVSIINRLDRETSGLTLVCKTAAAARQFSMLMGKRRIHKEYYAIAWGWPADDHYEIDAPLGRMGEHNPSNIWLKQAVHPLGAQARTTAFVEKRFERQTTNGSRFSLILELEQPAGQFERIEVAEDAIGFRAADGKHLFYRLGIDVVERERAEPGQDRVVGYQTAVALLLDRGEPGFGEWS